MKVSGAATVFQVSDLKTSVEFYRDVLGFEFDFEFGDYAGMHLGELHLHLCAHHALKRPVGGSAISAFADEVDEYCEKVKALGATIVRELIDEPYGMRDFVVKDPDGNVITFGCELH